MSHRKVLIAVVFAAMALALAGFAQAQCVSNVSGACVSSGCGARATSCSYTVGGSTLSLTPSVTGPTKCTTPGTDCTTPCTTGDDPTSTGSVSYVFPACCGGCTTRTIVVCERWSECGGGGNYTRCTTFSGLCGSGSVSPGAFSTAPAGPFVAGQTWQYHIEAENITGLGGGCGSCPGSCNPASCTGPCGRAAAHSCCLS